MSVLRLAALAGALAVVGALASPPAADAAPVARPNPAFVGVQLDYTHALRGPGGAPASLEPLDPSVTAAAVFDQARLAYQRGDDLGGFTPAPIGQHALSSGGRAIVGSSVQPQIPHLAAAADGQVNSFAAVGDEPSGTPDNGQNPVGGVQPTPSTPPGNGTDVPPANQGFGGLPSPPKATTTTTAPGATTTAPATTTTAAPPTTTTTTTTTTTRPPPTTTTTTTTPSTTTTTTTTTTPTTTSATTTTTSDGGGGGGPPMTGGSCGTPGLAITSDHATCTLNVTNMAPGGSTAEVLTIRNETSAPYTLSLKAAGPTNRLWDELRLGVWEDGTATPSPLPPLLYWTTQFNALRTLQPGESVRYRIVLYLPTTSGNDTQGLTATIDFVWHAQE